MIVNKIWTILDGVLEDVHPVGDWRRYTSNDIFVSDDKKKLVAAVFNDEDANIRGWLVESALKLALQSSYKDRLLAIDPLNTYDIPLNGKLNSVTIDNETVTFFTIENENNSPVYEDILKCSFDVSSSAVTVNGKEYKYTLTDNLTNPIPLTIDKSFMFLLPSNNVDVILTVKRVYKELASSILQTRIKAVLNNKLLREVSDANNVVEMVGSFVWQVV